jgi:superfamily II DNA/RNA helicase
VHRFGRTGRAGATGEAVSLVSADEVDQLAAIETLINQVLPRHDELGFVPDHRVPPTTLGRQIIKKPKKPKKPMDAGGKGKIHLGNWFDESEKPNARPIRKVPSLGGGKPAKKR